MRPTHQWVAGLSRGVEPEELKRPDILSFYDDILGIVLVRRLSKESVAHTFLAEILHSCPPPLLAKW